MSRQAWQRSSFVALVAWNAAMCVVACVSGVEGRALLWGGSALLGVLAYGRDGAGVSPRTLARWLALADVVAALVYRRPTEPAMALAWGAWSWLATP